MKLFKLEYIVFLLAAFMLGSCEDVVQVDIEGSDEGVIIDAWLNTLDQTQEIRVSNAIAYFDNRLSPGITDGVVKITRDDGVVTEFQHTQDGVYAWTPIPGETLGEVGNSFQLEINANGSTYTATAKMNRVPEIDTVSFEFRDDELGGDDGLYAEFFARDFPGQGDAYWIKTYRDDVFQSAPAQLNVAYDAGFDAGSGVDGIIFITPIREVLNNDANQGRVPYAEGEKIRVEIHSISQEGFSFLEIARDQINNGNNGIFALPLANAPSNISASGDVPALGFFNVAAVSVGENVAGM